MTLHEDLELCVPKTGPIRSYLEWAIRTTDAEHIFHLGAILPCLSHAAVQSGFVIDPQRRMRPTIWTFLVGVPAGSKSTAQKRAFAHYKSYRNGLAAEQTSDPFIFAEGSWPGIFEALTDKYDVELGMAHGIITRDEAGRLLDTKDTTIADNFCNLIDGEEVKRHLRAYRAENRAKPGAIKDQLRNPAFSGCLATTFARIREVTQASFMEGGLYSRFLWFVGSSGLPNPVLEIELHDDQRRRVLDEWIEWGKWLLGMQALGDERLVTFSDDAKELRRTTLFEDFKAKAQTDDRLNATRKRGLTQAQIIAGLYALSEQRTIVSYDDMLQAVNLIALSTSNLEQLDQKFLPSSIALHPKVLAEKAFGVIRAAGTSGPGCSRASLYKTLQCPKHILDQVIDTLLDEGAIDLVRPEGGTRVGRPAMFYRVTRKDRFGEAPRRVRPGERYLHVLKGEGDTAETPETVDGPQALDADPVSE